MAEELLTEDLLTRLLEEAKDAHVEYEEQTGTYDEDWPRWYARFILERLREMREDELSATDER
jgi:hypothetical protein